MNRCLLFLLACLVSGPTGALGVPARSIQLKPTAAAPDNVSGVVEVERSRSASAKPVRLSVRLRQLGPGMYVLLAETKTAPEPLFLGYIPVADPTAGPERKEGTKERVEPHIEGAKRLETKVEAALPPRVEAKDLEWVMIANQGGTILLEGRAAADGGERKSTAAEPRRFR